SQQRSRNPAFGERIEQSAGAAVESRRRNAGFLELHQHGMNTLVLGAGRGAQIIQHVHVADTGFVFDFGKVEVRRGDRAVHVEDDAAECHVNRAAINPNSQANATLYTSWTSFLTFSTNSGGMSLYPWSFWACSRTFFMSSSIVSACATKSQATPTSRQLTSFILVSFLVLHLFDDFSNCGQ